MADGFEKRGKKATESYEDVRDLWSKGKVMVIIIGPVPAGICRVPNTAPGKV